MSHLYEEVQFFLSDMFQILLKFDGDLEREEQLVLFKNTWKYQKC